MRKKNNLCAKFVCVLAIMVVAILANTVFTTQKAMADGVIYHKLDQSSAWGVNSQAGGSIYTTRDSVSVVPTNQNKPGLGVKLKSCDEAVLKSDVSNESYLVVDFQHAIARANDMFIEIESESTTYKQNAKDLAYYFINKESNTVNALKTGSNFAMNFASSANDSTSGLVVMPLASLGVTSAIDINKVSFFANYWIRMNIYDIGIATSFDASDLSAFTYESIWQPSENSFEVYNQATAPVTANYLEAGQAYLDNLKAGSNFADVLNIKFPDSMIGADNLVDLSGFAGFYANLGIKNYMVVTWTFTDEDGTTYNTYSANKKTQLFKSGSTTTNTRAKDFNSNADEYVFYPFTVNASGKVTTETFTSTSTSFNKKFKPIFKLQIDRGSSVTSAQTNAGQVVSLKDFTFVSDDTLFGSTVTVNSSTKIVPEYKTLYYGAENIFNFEVEKGQYVVSGTLNDVALTAEQILEINETNKLHFTVMGETKLDIKTEIKNYNVDYNLNGGRLNENETNPTTYTIADKLILASPVKEGFVFEGWFDQDDNHVIYLGTDNASNLSLTARFVEANVINVNLDYNKESGLAYLSRTQVQTGENSVLTVTPFYGKRILSIKCNDVEVIDDLNGDKLELNNISSQIDIQIEFGFYDDYAFEGGSVSSLYNGYYGSVFADKDAVALSTDVSLNSSAVAGDETLFNTIREYDGGITALFSAKAVLATDYIAIELSNLVNVDELFNVSVNSGENEYSMASALYYLIDENGTITSLTDNKIVTKAKTNTNKTTIVADGFSGMVIIPISAFGGVNSIDKVNVFSKINPLRFSISNIYLLDNYMSGNAIDLSNVIYEPNENNFAVYGSDASEYVNVRFLNAGDYELRNYANLADNNGSKYDSFYMSMPKQLIGDDGLVDIQKAGICGIAMEVENLNMEIINFAIRLAGSDNPSLTSTDVPLWQTSNSLPGARLLTESGLVKIGNSVYLPKEFTGTVYIPLDTNGFKNIGAKGEFPNKILPLIRIFPSAQSDISAIYSVNIKNMRFVTSEENYKYYTVTSVSTNGILNGMIAENAVGSTSNNKATKGTVVNYTVTPNQGYKLTNCTYVLGDSEELHNINVVDNKFSVTVSDDILISVEYALEEYTITYNLDGGTNHIDNANNFTYVRGFELQAPTKDGYIFKGWYLDSDFVNEITEIEDGMDENIVVYAKWESQVSQNPTGCAGSYGVSLTSVMLILMAMVFIYNRRRKLNEK